MNHFGDIGFGMKVIAHLLFALVGGLVLNAQIGETRTWTSVDGRAVKGKLLELSSEKIVIQRSSRPVTIPVRLLSKADQELVEKLAAQMLEDAALAGQDEKRGKGFDEGPYADAVKGEWVLGSDKHGLVHQLFIGREVKRKKAGATVPLFVHLHGASARADSVKAGKVEIAAKTITSPDWYKDHPCVVLVPTCPPDPMSWGKDEIQSKLEALIDDLVANLPIDRSRIYLSGYSMGGQGIGKLIERRPTLYAAALFADGGPKESWIGKTKTAMWSYYSGERDSSKAAELQSQFKEQDVEFRFTILPDAKHNGIHWKLAKDPEVWEWLVEQRLPEK